MYKKNKINFKFVICMFVALLITNFFVATPYILAEEKLNVWYIDYPPYYLNEKGKATGILVDRFNTIMKKAGVLVDYRCVSSKRVLRAIKNEVNIASIGWFKTKEREQYAKFSLPIYTNKPVEVFALNRAAEKISKFSSLESILNSQLFKIGLIDGQSEGDFVDGLVKKYPDQAVLVVGKQVQLIKMLVAGRFDFILLPPEEVEKLTQEAGVDLHLFSLLSMDDIPRGNKRYIMYSRSVSQKLIDKVDAVIANGYE